MADQFQYVKLPDGSYGKFAASATDAQIRAQVAKNFPIAYTSKQAAPAAAPDWQGMDTKPPENARFPKIGRTGYKAADFLSNALPGVGAVLGGMNVESGPGAVALAAAGGATGERASHYLNRLLYKNIPEESLGPALAQGALAGASEGTGRILTGALGKLIPSFRKAADTATAARSGVGVRMTPGEVSGNPMMKLGETVLEHLPGGSGTMKTFREAQADDAISFLNNQLEKVSSQNLSSEQAGQAVRKAISDAKAKSDFSVNAKYDEARALLGKKPGEFMSPEDFRNALANHEAAIGKQLPANTKVLGSAARRKLTEAADLYKQEQGRFDHQIFDRILSTDKPEIIGSYLEKAGLEDLRRLKTELPPHVQQNAARNVLENLIHKATDPQSGTVRARALSTSLKELGEGRGRLIFGSQYDNVMEGAQLLGKINSLDGAMFGRMHAAKVMGAAAVALGGLFGMGGLERAVEGVGSEMLFAKLASLAITRPGTAAKGLSILRGAAAAVTRGVPFAVDESFLDSPALPPLRLETQ